MTLLLTLVFGVSLFFAWRAVSELRGRVRELEAQSRIDPAAILGDLIARITRVEAAVRQLARQTGRADDTAAATGEIPATPAATAGVQPSPVPATVPATATAPLVDTAAPAAPTPAPVVAAASPSMAAAQRRLGDASAAAAPPAAVPGPQTVFPPPAAAATPAESEGSEAWEVVVGTSWLNKIGVLVFVVGVALLVGYSFTHIGPTGRVSMGFALSLAMLAGGVALERRDLYRNYAYGLIAGGWAGVYSTAFAMHAIPEARVLDSPTAATALLLAISAGMIGHSLRYRAQTVTALAYVAAYAALALVPITGFALVASVPLALSLLVVASRLGWQGVAVLGVASTYVLFVLRVAVVPDGSVDPGSLLPLLTLGACWVMFEAADIAAARASASDQAGSLSLFPLNAVGFIGAASTQLPVNDANTMAAFTALAAAAYFASAVIRARLAPPRAVADDTAARFTTMHAAVALATALAAWSIDLRLSGNAETLALLSLAQVVIVAGLVLGERPLRIIGGVVLAAAALHGGGRALATLMVTRPSAGVVASTTPIAVLVALACYFNRELVRARQAGAAIIERAYTWIAFGLIGLVLAEEVPVRYWTFAAAAFGLGLLEAGLRRSPGYRYQAYCAWAFAAVALLGRYLAGAQVALFDASTRPLPSDAWRVLLATAAVLYAGWYRLRAPARAASAPSDLLLASGIAGGLGTLALTLLPWHVMPGPAVAPIWAGMAVLSATLGAAFGQAGARWQGYLLAIAAALRASSSILPAEAASADELAAAAAVIVAAYATSLAPRRAIAALPHPSDDTEQLARIATSIATTLLLTALILNEAPVRYVTIGWGLEGLALLAAGFAARERALRLSGLGVFLACILKLFLSDLRDLEPLARIVSFVVLGLVLLAVSWTYTRYQAQIRRFL
jgi:uncharacterized membrane protein